MPLTPVRPDNIVQTAQSLVTRVAQGGSAAHQWLQNSDLLRGEHSARSLSDLIHHLRLLHGRYPGVLDDATNRAVEPASRAWLAKVSYAFAGERAYLARLAAAAGPVPSTPGPATDATMMVQRRALEMLTKSERHGCAIGAAMAVVLDWVHIRTVLDVAAARFDVEPPSYTVGDSVEIAHVADEMLCTGAAERVLLFGAQQVLSQHLVLWDLLSGRHQARLAADALPALPVVAPAG